MSRIMIAGTGSGCGKTTVTCAVLGALKLRNIHALSFKAGPDYIDPMFHKKITGVEARNLDIFLMNEENVKYALKKQAHTLSIIEGVMGLYDGIGSSSYGSANHLALLTETPVILVVNAKGKSQSICAEIQGYMNFEKNNVSGIILNNVRETMYPFYKKMIEEKLEISVLGFMPNIPQANIKSRHLGLITTNEISNIQKKLELLADAATKYIDIDKLLSIAQKVNPILCSDPKIESIKSSKKPVIYIAVDKAFCFYYEDNHDLLMDLGAELRFFSILEDNVLPDDAGGLILWGGYPELHATKLQDNHNMKTSLKTHIKNGLPVYAECGGFMYLQESLMDLQGNSYDMLGILKGHSIMTSNLQNFGYITLEANENTVLCSRGEKINAHSFHYSTSSNKNTSFTATKKSNGITYRCIVSQNNIFGGYPHIHFFSNPKLARNFVQKCIEYRKEMNHETYYEPSRD